MGGPPAVVMRANGALGLPGPDVAWVHRVRQGETGSGSRQPAVSSGDPHRSRPPRKGSFVPAYRVTVQNLASEVTEVTEVLTIEAASKGRAIAEARPVQGPRLAKPTVYLARLAGDRHGPSGRPRGG